MKTKIPNSWSILFSAVAGLMTCLALAINGSGAEVDLFGRQKLSQDTRAVIVVTGLKLREEPTGSVEVKDLSVADGAVVRVTKRGARAEEKQTAVFGNRQPIDLITGEIGVHSAPTVTRAPAVTGASRPAVLGALYPA